MHIPHVVVYTTTRFKEMFKGKPEDLIPMEHLIEAGYCPNCRTFIREILNAGPSPITDLRFCPNCGIQVWTKCSCDQHLRYDDPVCTSCGKENPIHLQQG